MNNANVALSTALIAACAGLALAQQTVPMEAVLSTQDNGGFTPISGSLNGTQTWLKRYNSAFQSTAPTIDGSGNIAFTAVLTAGVGTPPVVGGPFSSGVGYNQFTVWYGGPGSLSLQARYGDPTLDNANCGGAGAVFTSRATPTIVMSPAGHMYIGAYGTNGGTITQNLDHNMMWTGLAGNLLTLVRGNDQLLNVGDGTSHEWYHPTSENGDIRLNNLGQTPFFGWLKANLGDTGAYGTNDSFVGLASTGTNAVAGQNARVISSVRTSTAGLISGVSALDTVRYYFNPAMNHSATLFNVYGLASGIGDAASDGSNDYVLVMSTLAGNAYTNTVLGREGGPTGVGAIEYAAMPTTGGPLGGPTGPFARVIGQDLSNSGRVVFMGAFKQGVGGITSANDAALMTYKDGVTSIIAQKGPASAIDASLPGTLAMSAVPNAAYRVTSSNSDQVAWVGLLSGTGINELNDQFLAVSTIASDGSVTHKLILREGDQVPGMAPGTLWGGRGNPSTQSWPGPTNIAINASGLLVFQSYLTGTGFEDGLLNSTLWTYYPSCGVMRMIARTGGSVAGLDLTGQYAGIAWNSSPNGEGSTVGFNDENWFTFLAMDGQSTPPAGDAALMRVHFCPADLDDGSATGQPDGGVDINDLLYFLAQYEQGICGADLDGGAGSGLPDGGVDINDLLFFLAHYEGGC